MLNLALIYWLKHDDYVNSHADDGHEYGHDYDYVIDGHAQAFYPQPLYYF